MEDSRLLVYNQSDMQTVLNFVDSLQYKGVTMARQVASIATILESGKPLAAYEKKEGEADGTVRQEL